MKDFTTALKEPSDRVKANVKYGIANCMREDFISITTIREKPCSFLLSEVRGVDCRYPRDEGEYNTTVFFKGVEKPWRVNFDWQDLLWIWLDYKKQHSE